MWMVYHVNVQIYGLEFKIQSLPETKLFQNQTWKQLSSKCIALDMKTKLFHNMYLLCCKLYYSMDRSHFPISYKDNLKKAINS